MAEAVLATDDPEIILDLRKLNGNPRSTKFDEFWSELASYEETTLAVDERRHTDVLHMPLAISIRHIHDLISERLEKKFPGEKKPIPSLEWIRYQFWPKNPFSTSALRYTGRFPVKFGVQIRQMRKSHPDARYVSVLLKYLKGFAVLNSQYTSYVSADDKAIIPVGDPTLPVSTGVRGHNRALVPMGGPQLSALDHDFHTCGIVPSAAFFVHIPESPKDSFFQGKAFVTLKDKVTQPSSALRHSAEISSIVRSHFTPSKPVLILTTDGGVDHRLTFASVQVALICLFKSLNLDMLVAVRTCPYQSWTNLAERVMSTLNLALQNVSLARSEMPAEFEAALKNKNTLQEIREAIARTDQLKEALQDSMSFPIVQLCRRFTALKLKDEPIRCGTPASDDELTDFFEHIRFFEPSLVCGQALTKPVVEKSKPLSDFIKAHCHASHYAFQIKKCTNQDCFYCSDNSIRMPSNEFEKLSFVPLPLLDATKEHYRPFLELYGTMPEDKRPSLQLGQSDAQDADRSHRELFRNTKARSHIICQECLKPRVIFSACRLSEEQKVVVAQAVELHLYTCGSVLFPPTSPHHSTIVVRQALTCNDPVEAQYYSATLVSFPPVCYYCGMAEETLVNDDEFRELKQQYSVVRPICFMCKSQGKHPFTSHPNNMAKRKKT